LINFIEVKTYEKYLLNQTNFDLTVPDERRIQAKLAVKDEYMFDFAELSPEYSEHELELQLVNHIRAFLIEMGGDFSFLGNQYHLVVGSRDLYIDLLLFHRRLRSLVAIELKIGEFEAEYAGKMQLYLTALDEQVKLPDENPSIGIIICKNKDRTYVEYALKRSNVPIGVATYQLSSSLPENMKEMLPEPEEIVRRLRIFEKN
jgi:predicted nuclease of restriction endonuclease-like (RecB) superfamily